MERDRREESASHASEEIARATKETLDKLKAAAEKDKKREAMIQKRKKSR